MRFLIHGAISLGVVVGTAFCELDEQRISKGASLGVSLMKPDTLGTAQLPELPRGVGFVVISMAKGGAGEVAGMKEADLLWKLEDQMLVNEGQLATLLRIWKPGDTVLAHVYREGVKVEIPIVLGTAGRDEKEISIENLLEAAGAAEAETPTRVIDVRNRTASLESTAGSLEITRGPGGDEIRVRDPSGEIVYDTIAMNGRALSGVPKNWEVEIRALRRGLDQTLEEGKALKRLPRPRIVPPPPSDNGD